MKYEKPEVVLAATASNAIQFRQSKQNGSVADTPSSLPKLTAMAYEADE